MRLLVGTVILISGCSILRGPDEPRHDTPLPASKLDWPLFQVPGEEANAGPPPNVAKRIWP
jgi:hypothetical protein